MERKMDDNEQSESTGDVLSGTETERIETDEFLNFIQLRNHLKNLKFGWMKFYTFKSTLFLPGFVHPADADGKCRAQSVKPDGSVISKKNIFFEFSKNVDKELKDKAGILALKKLNKIFYFSYE